MLVKILIAAH